MTASFPLARSLDELGDLGCSLDRIASVVEAEPQEQALNELADGLDRAEGLIAELVRDADSRQLLADPRLISIKAEWLDRFDRFVALIERARHQLDGEAGARLSRHRASDAYLKNQLS